MCVTFPICDETYSLDTLAVADLPTEEHLLFAIRAARTYIDSGYTMCVGAASAKDRLDVVCRNAINAGDIAGPRYLANAREIAKREGALIEVSFPFWALFRKAH